MVASFVEAVEEAPSGSQIGIVDRGANVLQLRPIAVGVWRHLRASRTGRRIALGGWNVQVLDVPSGRWQRIAGSAETGRETSGQAVWSPYDSAVAFVQSFSPPAFRMLSMASGTVRTVRELPFRQRRGQPGSNAFSDWSPDGRRIAGTSGNEAWEYDVSADSVWQLFQAGGAIADLRYHPSGRWITYTAAGEGKTEVFLRAYPAGAPIRVSTDGGRLPRWNASGTELFYIDENENVVAVPVRFGSTPALGSVSVVVPAAVFTPRHPEEFDVAPDGQRFYFIVSSDARSLDLVLNWRAPVR